MCECIVAQGQQYTQDLTKCSMAHKLSENLVTDGQLCSVL